jgi:hypothetical protein
MEVRPIETGIEADQWVGIDLVSVMGVDSSGVHPVKET